MSKESLIAKSGYKAEEIFRTCPIIKEKLEIFFSKKIVQITSIHGQKYDVVIKYDDDSIDKIQIKKIVNLNGRGDSFDRRNIKNTFTLQSIIDNLSLLTLNRKTKTKTKMSSDQKLEFIKICNENHFDIKQYLQKTLLGEYDNKNDYFCIIKTDNDFSNKELYIIKSSDLYSYIEKSININICLKENGTCLHISPNIYLQRKGGGSSDKSPNDIQAKLKITNDILSLCNKIM